jgi:prefoldin subunit 5
MSKQNNTSTDLATLSGGHALPKSLSASISKDITPELVLRAINGYYRRDIREKSVKAEQKRKDLNEKLKELQAAREEYLTNLTAVTTRLPSAATDVYDKIKDLAMAIWNFMADVSPADLTAATVKKLEAYKAKQSGVTFHFPVQGDDFKRYPTAIQVTADLEEEDGTAVVNIGFSLFTGVSINRYNEEALGYGTENDYRQVISVKVSDLPELEEILKSIATTRQAIRDVQDVIMELDAKLEARHEAHEENSIFLVENFLSNTEDGKDSLAALAQIARASGTEFDLADVDKKLNQLLLQ